MLRNATQLKSILIVLYSRSGDKQTDKVLLIQPTFRTPLRSYTKSQQQHAVATTIDQNQPETNYFELRLK